MIQFLGALLLTGGSTALGLGAANRLRSRTKALRALSSALQMLDRDLSFRLTPMPELFQTLANTAEAPASNLFQVCVDGINQQSPHQMTKLWESAVNDSTPVLTADDRRILLPLGNVLGRYGAEDQRAAIMEATRDLDRAALQAEEIHLRKGRIYSIMGLVTGTFLVILLL
jgi:stage III sporulation protein AB